MSNIAYPILPTTEATFKNWSIKLAELTLSITNIRNGVVILKDEPWLLTNVVATKTFDPTNTTSNEMAQVLATLIQTLSQGKIPDVS